MTPPILKLTGVHAHYGQSHILHGINLTVQPGTCVALLGRNGMGKTTTIRALFGLTPPSAGSVEIDGVDMAGRAPHHIARAGLGLVPEGRGIFRDLTVRENLAIAIGTSPGDNSRHIWTIEGILDLFPRLRERLTNMGNQLSGGEQQMLAIGRALATNPRLLVLDEATEGLAPLVRNEIWRVIRAVQEHGVAVLIIDKDLNTLLTLADTCVILERGRVAYADTSAALAGSPEIHQRLLGV